jgi:hypothetical protein
MNRNVQQRLRELEAAHKVTQPPLISAEIEIITAFRDGGIKMRDDGIFYPVYRHEYYTWLADTLNEMRSDYPDTQLILLTERESIAALKSVQSGVFYISDYPSRWITSQTDYNRALHLQEAIELYERQVQGVSVRTIEAVTEWLDEYIKVWEESRRCESASD